MELLTARLRVRRFSSGDEAALHAILSDPEVMEHLEPPFTPAQTHDFLHRAGLGSLPLIHAVERTADGALIGYLILHAFPETPHCPNPDWELGWVLARDCWGRGYAAELTAAVLTWARQQHIPRLVLECVPQQAATRRLAQNFGFVLAQQADGLLQYRLPLC